MSRYSLIAEAGERPDLALTSTNASPISKLITHSAKF